MKKSIYFSKVKKKKKKRLLSVLCLFSNVFLGLIELPLVFKLNKLRTLPRKRSILFYTLLS